jgi:hypothetical protein
MGTVYTHNRSRCGFPGHGCGVEIPDPRVTCDEPYREPRCGRIVGLGLLSVRCDLSPFMRIRAVMRDDQVGQLDPSRVSIIADLDSGKLIDGVIVC